MPFLSAVTLVERECSVVLGVGPCNMSAGQLCDSTIERTSIKFINTDVYRASILTAALRILSLCWLTFCYCLARSWCGTLKYVWKVKLSLCLAEYHVMRTCGGGGIAPHILPRCYVELSGQLHAPERTPGTHGIGGWSRWGRVKIPSRHCLESNPRRAARSLVSILTELP
jgi:hypothetical protein